ncbi:MAG: NUDIX domain-containing protein, partial [Candidatus Omnitrophica bacterium]|nr:NUDIX domain-containing protein [Candidatus Omnitrophota bacterium]
GKIKKGEAPNQALARELKEELGVDLAEARHAATVRHAYTRFSVRLSAWECRVKPDPAVDRKHRWVSAGKLKKYPMAAGTVKVLEAFSMSAVDFFKRASAAAHKKPAAQKFLKKT